MRARRQSERTRRLTHRRRRDCRAARSREQLQLQRDALLEEIYSRDEYSDSIERDLDQMLQTEGKLREEVSSKENSCPKRPQRTTAHDAIEEQASVTSC